MSGLNNILQTALRSMDVHSQSLAVASNNIANEGTPGYARQRLIVQTAAADLHPMLTGRGVEAVTIEAVRDHLLEGRLRQQASAAAGDDVLHEALRQVEVLFNDAAESGMLDAITGFFNAFHGLALDPASTQARDAVVVAAEGLVQDFAARVDALARVQDAASRGIEQDVARVNALAGEIARISTEIRLAEAGGQHANDLRTNRSELVRQLSELIEIREIDSPGSYSILVGGGGVLVAGNHSAALTAEFPADGPARILLGSADIAPSLDSGSIHGRIEVRDRYVPQYRTGLDALAFEVAGRVNAIHAGAYTRSGATGIDFFAPMAAVPGAASALELGAAIQADPANIAAASGPDGTDNGAATAIANLLHTRPPGGLSIVDQYGSLVFTVANDTARTRDRLEDGQALLHQLEDRRDAISGVSVDEETMKILQFQRAYQASANMVRVVDELLQTLLGMGA